MVCGKFNSRFNIEYFNTEYFNTEYFNTEYASMNVSIQNQLLGAWWRWWRLSSGWR